MFLLRLVGDKGNPTDDGVDDSDLIHYQEFCLLILDRNSHEPFSKTGTWPRLAII